jgi:integrase
LFDVKHCVSSVRKRRLKSGKIRWLVDLRDGSGRRHARQFSTKAEAEAFRAQATVQIDEGRYIADRSSPTVAQAADLWLKKCRAAELELSTLRGYEQHVRIHIVPRLGQVRLSRLKPEIVAAFFDGLAETCSVAMRRKIRTSLCSIVSEAQSRGLATTNAVASYRFKLRSESSTQAFPERSQISALVSTNEGIVRAVLQTAAFTGLRQGELRALRWSDVNFETRTISVRRSATVWGKIKLPKSVAGRRQVPFGQQLSDVLAELKQAVGASDTDLVFPSERGTPLNPANLYNRIFKPAMARAQLVDLTGKPLFRFHDLRHAAAAMFIAHYREPKKIQSLLGHASIKLTYDTYGYLFQDVTADSGSADAIEARVFQDACTAGGQH